MNQTEFLQRYKQDIPMYEAWGQMLITTILEELNKRGHADDFIKIPPKPRIKSSDSIIGKAFFRKEKSYKDPYEEITDKVGIRFVVLEVGDISAIESIICDQVEWTASKDVDFEINKREKPELFEYQSVHYVVRNKREIVIGNIRIVPNTPCEIQIRTLLQHAYAELSHQTVYKSNEMIDPMIRRKLARSIALIEATDQLFSEVKDAMRSDDILYRSFVSIGSGISHSFSGYIDKLNRTIFDQYRQFIEQNGITSSMIETFIKEKPFIIDKIDGNVFDNILYRQPIILMLFYLADQYKNTLKSRWPFEQEYLDPVFVDLGLSC